MIKKYTFSKEELTRLQDIEFGMISFRAALQGMLINKEIILAQTYKRLGIEENTKSIEYNLGKNEITVSDKEPVK